MVLGTLSTIAGIAGGLGQAASAFGIGGSKQKRPNTSDYGKLNLGKQRWNNRKSDPLCRGDRDWETT